MKKSLVSPDDKARITEAIGLETKQSILWLNFAAKLTAIGCFGAAEYFKQEAKEEAEHAQVWVEFLNDRGDVGEIGAIPAQKTEFSTLEESIDEALETELSVTDFYDKFCEDTQDHAIKQRLLFFVEKQTDAVGNYLDLKARAELGGGDKCATILLDQYMKP